MLTDAKMKISSIIGSRLEVSGAIKSETRFGGWSEIGSATDEPGNIFGHGIQHLGRRLTSGQPLGIGRESRQVLVPTCWQFAALHQTQVFGQRGKIFLIFLQ